MTAYVAPDKLEEYFEKYSDTLRELGFSEEEIVKKMANHAKDQVVLAYTKDWMDDNLDYWINTILNVKGGYWIVQDLIHQPHCEYEHYRWRGKMSYEKTNVGDATAKRELSPRSYEIYQISKKMKERNKSKTDKDLEITCEVKIPKEVVK